ncbi:hypothetical protein WMF20_23040 [Sorangium sp. So ce834]|uniref:hypothetical protein n=1 Tax=Sorangium sp. So ce834 TaxID=3133321 RepID=UPI003F63F04B
MSTVAIRGTGNPRQPTEHVDCASTANPSRTREHAADASIPFSDEAVHFDKFCRGHVALRELVASCVEWSLDPLSLEGRALALEERLRIDEGLVTTAFLHALMAVRDVEVDRIKTRCTRCALPEGWLMSGCAYHNLDRGSGPRTTTSVIRARRLALEPAYVTGQTTRGDGGR